MYHIFVKPHEKRCKKRKFDDITESDFSPSKDEEMERQFNKLFATCKLFIENKLPTTQDIETQHVAKRFKVTHPRIPQKEISHARLERSNNEKEMSKLTVERVTQTKEEISSAMKKEKKKTTERKDAKSNKPKKAPLLLKSLSMYRKAQKGSIIQLS